MFPSLQAMQWIIWLKGNDTDRRIFIFKPPASADQTSCCSETCYKMSNTRQFFQNFIPGSFIMCLPVIFVFILICIKISIGCFLHHGARYILGPVGSFKTGCEDELYTQGTKNFLSFSRGIFRKTKCYGYAQNSADPGISYPRISAGCIQEGFPGMQEVFFYRITKNSISRPGFNAPGELFPFLFGEKQNIFFPEYIRKSSQRRIADLRSQCMKPGLQDRGW